MSRMNWRREAVRKKINSRGSIQFPSDETPSRVPVVKLRKAKRKRSTKKARDDAWRRYVIRLEACLAGGEPVPPMPRQLLDIWHLTDEQIIARARPSKTYNVKSATAERRRQAIAGRRNRIRDWNSRTFVGDDDDGDNERS